MKLPAILLPLLLVAACNSSSKDASSPDATGTSSPPTSAAATPTPSATADAGVALKDPCTFLTVAQAQSVASAVSGDVKFQGLQVRPEPPTAYGGEGRLCAFTWAKASHDGSSGPLDLEIYVNEAGSGAPTRSCGINPKNAVTLQGVGDFAQAETAGGCVRSGSIVITMVVDRDSERYKPQQIWPTPLKQALAKATA
jgi:hypothetical protein